jgi:hypothetical protein
MSSVWNSTIVAVALLVQVACKSRQADPTSGGSSDRGGADREIADGARHGDVSSHADAGSVTASGLAAGSGAASAGSPIKFDRVPAGWEVGDGKLRLVVAVNGTRFPVEDRDPPKGRLEYAAWLGRGWQAGMLDQVTKSAAVPGGFYFETKQRFRFLIDAGDERIVCGGSRYDDEDHDKIASIRDGAVAAAKMLCASERL